MDAIEIIVSKLIAKRIEDNSSTALDSQRLRVCRMIPSVLVVMNGARFVSGFTNCQAKHSNIASFYAGSADLPTISGALVGVYGGGVALAGLKTKGATFQPPLCIAQQPECQCCAYFRPAM
jgi:hypothetical protein